jgi:hypothetical protein
MERHGHHHLASALLTLAFLSLVDDDPPGHDLIRVAADAAMGESALPHGTAVTLVSERSPFRVYIGDARVRTAAERALHLAALRFAKPRCQGVLSDFVDDSGRPLGARLMELRVSIQEYLRAVVFTDGSTYPQCRRETLLAFTVRGSRVVYLCSQSFERKVSQSLSDAAQTVIHEILHTLGLGENPPTSQEITSQVRLRC